MAPSNSSRASIEFVSAEVGASASPEASRRAPTPIDKVAKDLGKPRVDPVAAKAKAEKHRLTPDVMRAHGMPVADEKGE